MNYQNKDAQSESQALLKSRIISQVEPPASHRPHDTDLGIPSKSNGHSESLRNINHEYLRGHFFRQGRLTEFQALCIIENATRIFTHENNLVSVQSPVIICGDLQGQYYDLLKIFERGGSRDDYLYLFLGGYVGAGLFSMECLLYLYALKIRNPTRIILLRGNFECQSPPKSSQFEKEACHKYSKAVYDACLRSFRALPVAALVDNKFFCVHGGVSPSMRKVEDVNKINRFREPGLKGLLCDLLWSDPVPHYGPSDLGDRVLFKANSSRGCSVQYTYRAVCKFLEENGLYGVIRGHDAHMAGFKFYEQTPGRKFPSVITVFSAPNLFDEYKNRGAFLRYEDRKCILRQFNASPHPFQLRDFKNAFTWSLPFLGRQVNSMLLHLLTAQIGNEHSRSLRARRGIIKAKILAVSRFLTLLHLLRREADTQVIIIGHSTGQRTFFPMERTGHRARYLPVGLSLEDNGYNSDWLDSEKEEVRSVEVNEAISISLASDTSQYSLAPSRTVSTDYGVYFRRMALSQDTDESQSL